MIKRVLISISLFFFYFCCCQAACYKYILTHRGYCWPNANRRKLWKVSIVCLRPCERKTECAFCIWSTQRIPRDRNAWLGEIKRSRRTNYAYRLNSHRNYNIITHLCPFIDCEISGGYTPKLVFPHTLIYFSAAVKIIFCRSKNSQRFI